jgi:uncharacterized protein (TIGR02453 family)
MALRVNPFEEEGYPPFDGFPADTRVFLRSLARNNNREWFEKNKRRYEESVKEPMLALLGSLALRVKKIDPDLAIEPRSSMYRIYRDIRFSKDKTPYKTHVAAAFTFSGLDRKYDAGYYFHVSPAEVGVGGGMYMPSGPALKNLRAAIDRDSSALRSILKHPKFKKLFGELYGESLTRVPQGYEKEHPDADLLKRKQFFCWADLDAGIVEGPEFEDVLMKHFEAMTPLVKYLAQHSK